MLDILSGRLSKVVRFLKGEVKITEENMQQALRDIRLSLLEADVNFRVVKQFIENIRQKAVGVKVHDSLNPAQQLIKIVNQELVALLGSESVGLNSLATKPTVILLAGLQGSGKTTTAGKLALFLKNRGSTALLASLDLKRPAAVEQLRVIAGEIDCPFFPVAGGELKEISGRLVGHSRDLGFDFLIADTAGRLHVDDELMNELVQLRQLLQPAEVIYVADALIGQDAVNSALEFSRRVGIDSVILTKLDADSRGGAALSIVQVTGKPIKFVGVGEKYDDFQEFHPERLASRILGMGDMLTLIEKAEDEFDKKEAEQAARKLLKDEFTLADLAAQLLQVRKLGSLQDIMAMLPNLGAGMKTATGQIDEKRIDHVLAIISSMTIEERENQKVMNGRRRLRIARGSGRPVTEVNQLLRQHQEMCQQMKKPFFRKMLKRIDIFSKMM